VQTVSLPELREYIDHVEKGISLRRIAQRDGVHPSTVLRRVRKIEAKRDDPLLDDILTRMSQKKHNLKTQKAPKMNIQAPTDTSPHDKDIMRVLRRLSERNAFLVMSLNLPKAVVMRGKGDKQVRSAVLTRDLGQDLLLKDFIELIGGGKFNRYEITHAGRLALKRMVAEAQEQKPSQGFCEAVTPFQGQHIEWGERNVPSETGRGFEKIRVNLRESPINSLGRKKGKDGEPFLGQDLLQAGERLREDFELAQMGPRVAQNWDRFLVGSDRGNFGSGEGGGSSQAQSRFHKALTALGPGLGDIAVRCCCFLEGLEAAEKRMGWSARSGKVVLRIALQRLRLHYVEAYGGVSDRIG